MAFASASGSSSSYQWSYDVFLSFINEDDDDGSSRSFIDELCKDLNKRDYQIFKDDDGKRNLEEHITSEFLDTIEESKVSIIVFSKNYASSIWCLDELVKMLECKHEMGQTVLPVFYKVDPAHVRHQIGILKETFVAYEERFKSEMKKVETWKVALTEAANLSGWHIKDVADGYLDSLLSNSTNFHFSSYFLAIKIHCI